MRIEMTFRGLEKLALDLGRIRHQAIPYAMRDAVNTAAFEGRRIWGDEIRKTFVTRNTFTAGRALQVDKAKIGAGTVEAILGSTARYMGLQETGGTVHGGGAHRPIPGPAAAGQAPGGKRTRLVRAGNRLRAISAAKGGKGSQTRLQRNAVALAVARRTGKKFAVLERPRGGVGLFAISGGKRKAKTRLVWDLSRRSAKVPPHATLGPTMKRMQARVVPIYHEALIKQLKRWHVAGY